MNDDWKCLGCHCTFDSGCELERQTNATLKTRQRYIPPRKLPPPIVSHYERDPEASKKYAREQYRKRIEARGGTVRARR